MVAKKSKLAKFFVKKGLDLNPGLTCPVLCIGNKEILVLAFREIHTRGITAMFATTVRSLKSLLILSCVIGLAGLAHAQDTGGTLPPAPVKKARKSKKAKSSATTAPKGEEPPTAKAVDNEGGAPTGENLKFNTDYDPKSTDRHEPMHFSDPGDAPLGTPRPEYADTTPDDTGYKAYLGYPKNQAGVHVATMNLASSWGYGANTYNFTSGVTGYGVDYRLLVSPMWQLEANYQHASVTLTEAKVGGLTFHDSTINIDTYDLKNRWCFIGKTSFYRQLCPGIDVGNDGYPIVNFTSATDLALTREQDFYIGANLTYQQPITEPLLFTAKIGYNYGTGLGTSGYLTSKGDTSYYLNAGVEWTIARHHVILVNGEYKHRDAKVQGSIPSSGGSSVLTDTWQTNSSYLGARLGYLYSF